MFSFSHINLWASFRRLRPWTTKFKLKGRDYGGWYDAANDTRIGWFAAAFPDAISVLELGSLEGGHTCGLTRLPGVKRVVGVEGREENIIRAKFAQKKLGYRAEFVQADLEAFDLSKLGRFDAVYCCGLLYHLTKPWELLARIAKVTDRLFLSTHFTFENPPPANENGIPGQWVGEFGLADPLSGLSRQSFWPTRTGLTRMLNAVGFRAQHVWETNEKHPNGPLVTLSAAK